MITIAKDSSLHPKRCHACDDSVVKFHKVKLGRYGIILCSKCREELKGELADGETPKRFTVL